VAHARRFLSSVLPHDDPAVADELIEVAELLTSELVSNAILHAGTTFDVCVDIVDDDDAVVISVVDHSPILPVLRQPDLEAPGGRGIFLVDRLSAAWGVDPVDHGKRVWCRVVPERIPATAQV
jgi:anti-sigma regulatory factor (Ser/Thr protein kinase)